MAKPTRGANINQGKGSTKGAKKSPWHGKGKGRWRYVTLKKPPPGTYDPKLDWDLSATRRGLSDLIGDVAPVDLTQRQKLLGKKSKAPAGTQALRDLFDFQTAAAQTKQQLGDISTDYTTGVARENTGYGQTMADLLYQRDTLNRNYTQLANQQRQAFNAAGLAEGGAGAQAATKRAANLAFEAKPITAAETAATTQHRASLDDMLREQQRATRDVKNQFTQTGQAYGRGVQDRATQLYRARRDASIFRQQSAVEKMRQYTDEYGGRTRRKVGIKKYRTWRKRGLI